MKRVTVITHEEEYIERKDGLKCQCTVEVEYFETFFTMKFFVSHGETFFSHEIVGFRLKDVAGNVGAMFCVFKPFSWKILDFDSEYPPEFVDACVSSWI